MDNVTPFQIGPKYTTIEVREMDAGDDSPVLVAKVRKNLSMAQREVLTSFDMKTVKLIEIWECIHPYIVDWNFQAENAKGEYEKVIPPAEGGVDSLRVLAAQDPFNYMTLMLLNGILHAAFGGTDASKEREARKNSSAASGDSATNSDAAGSTQPSSTTKRSGTDSSSPDEKTNTTKRRASAKQKPT